MAWIHESPPRPIFQISAAVNVKKQAGDRIDSHRAKDMSLLGKYILSHVGLVLFTCSLIVTVSCYATVRRLHTEIREHQQYQLNLLAEDLDRRVGVMREIALEIAITSEYKPVFFTRNPYYETFLLEELAKYEGRTRLDRGYFLIYSAYDSLFTKDAKYSPDIYLAHRFDTLRAGALYAACRDAESFTILAGDPLPPGEQLWCVPIRLLAVQSELSRATLVFIVDNASFQQYVTAVIGENTGGLSLWYRDTLISAFGDDPPATPEGDLFSASTAEEPLTLRMRPNRFDSIQSMAQFVDTNLLLFGALALLAALLGVFLAYRNYRPIRQTVTRWGKHGPEQPVRNELSSLHMAFARYDRQQREDSERIKTQLHMLRRQMVALLLNGKAADLNSETARALGVRMPHPVFCAVSVYADAGSDESELRLMEAAHRIADDALCCYAGFYPDAGCVAVLLNMAAPSGRADAVKRLSDACREAGLSVLMGVGRCYPAANKLQASFLEAVSALNTASDEKIRFYEETKARDDVFVKQRELLDALLGFLRQGNGSGAQAQLSALMEHIEANTPSILLRCYLCTRVLNEIVQAAGRLSLPVPREQVGWIYMSTSTKAYHEGISEVLWTLCGQVRSRDPDGSEVLANELVQYIDAHCLDYALSLDMLAERFSVSSSQVSRIFRQLTGEPFKDYVVRQRIAHAQALIAREELTIAELCARVGYSNVSHFIKLFKSQVGITPAAYKKHLLEK